MEAIVLYPTPAIGHLISMVELGKLILTHKPSLSIHILIATPPYSGGSTGPYIAKVSATFSSIIFHHLPTIILPPSTTTRHHESLTFEVLRLNNENVHNTLTSISTDYKISALVGDFFCGTVFTVTDELKIPTYLFMTSGAGFLSLFLYLPTIHKNTDKSFEDMDNNTLLDIPGIPKLPAKDMPKPVLKRDDTAYNGFLVCANRWSKSAGIIVNTFDSLEPRAIQAVVDGQSVPDGPTAPVYCIGPLIASNGGGCKHECLTWLDSQPSKSVVFLCFGSLGLFTVEQLKEIAIGLEKSGQRFLWVVKNPPVKDESVAIFTQPDPDLDSILPEGFLDRTKLRGRVVKSWAPQVAVLNHDSVGGFVTHCGWNSVLEAVRAGVPMVAWPLYAEQRLNRVLLVEEIGIALPMTESETGFVSAVEVEKRIIELMDMKNGELIRERAATLKNGAKAALSEGGSSCVALTKLVESWRCGCD